MVVVLLTGAEPDDDVDDVSANSTSTEGARNDPSPFQTSKNDSLPSSCKRATHRVQVFLR